MITNIESSTDLASQCRPRRGLQQLLRLKTPVGSAGLVQV